MSGRFPTRLRAKLSRAVPLWKRTVSSVVVVERSSPTFLLITTHRDSRIYRTPALPLLDLTVSTPIQPGFPSSRPEAFSLDLVGQNTWLEVPKAWVSPPPPR